MRGGVEVGVLVRRFCKTVLPVRGVRIAVAALLATAIGAGLYAAHAAPPAMATKKDDAFQTSIPAAVVLDPDSNSLLFDKNGDQLVAPASLAKLMTLEYVFNEIKQAGSSSTTRSGSAKTPGARAARRPTARPCSRRSTARSKSTI